MVKNKKYYGCFTCRRSADSVKASCLLNSFFSAVAFSLVLFFLAVSICSCAQDPAKKINLHTGDIGIETKILPGGQEPPGADEDVAAGSGYEALQKNGNSQVSILTQNMMLIPFEYLAPRYRDRTGLLIEELDSGNFDIICLQEVFSDASQDRILDRWHGEEDFKWTGIKNAQEVETLSGTGNIYGIKVYDLRPNNKPAKISFGPHYVLGPDSGGCNFLRQDSGLLILSKYPVVAAGAFSFSDAGGTDRLANKGVVYAKIKTGPGEEDCIHFFNTHFQSHDYPGARFSNLEELFVFIARVLSEDAEYTDVQENPETGKNEKQSVIQEESKGAYPFKEINPVIIAGDLNIGAFIPEYWAEKADIIFPGMAKDIPEYEQAVLSESEDYGRFIGELGEFTRRINDFFGLNGPDQEFYLADLWAQFLPSEPGFTWMGKDWQTGAGNPYGPGGNPYAIETGPPQRIDYILFFGGNGSFKLSPEYISLFPSDSTGVQLSDHIGLALDCSW